MKYPHHCKKMPPAGNIDLYVNAGMATEVGGDWATYRYPWYTEPHGSFWKRLTQRRRQIQFANFCPFCGKGNRRRAPPTLLPHRCALAAECEARMDRSETNGVVYATWDTGVFGISYCPHCGGRVDMKRSCVREEAIHDG